jgi:hypothetical protein
MELLYWQKTKKRKFCLLNASEMIILGAVRRALLSGYSFGVRKLGAVPTYGNSFAMSGCGWLIPFYFGVISAMKARGVMNSESIYSGTSAGSLASLVAACDLNCTEAMQLLASLPADEVFLSDKNSGLRRTLVQMLPPDTVERCQGRLHVTLTKVWPNPMRSATVISHFKSKEHIVDVVAASCFIPLYSAQQLAVTVGEQPERYIDGGVFAFMPPVGDVTISPFPQRFVYDLLPAAMRPTGGLRPACIYLDRSQYPLRRLLGWVLTPPPEAEMWDLFHSGERVANAWMDKHSVRKDRDLVAAGRSNQLSPKQQ